MVTPYLSRVQLSSLKNHSRFARREPLSARLSIAVVLSAAKETAALLGKLLGTALASYALTSSYQFFP